MSDLHHGVTMNLWKLLARCAFVFVVTTAAEAATVADVGAVPAEAASVLKERFPSFALQTLKRGDLDRDGIGDVAMLVIESGEPNSDGRIVVLKCHTGGGFEMMSESRAYPSTYGTTTTYSLDIKKGALFLTESGPSGDDAVQIIEFQFKYVDRQMVLIGSRQYREGMGRRGDARQISINYSTGDRLEWRRLDGKRVEVKAKLDVTDRMKLEAFDWNLPRVEDSKWSIGPDLKIRTSPQYD